MKPLLIAHRGDTVNYPENTFSAFRSAFAKGSDGIEMDIQYNNNSLIVVHDYLFDRTKSYPKLSEILKKFSQKGRMEIEVKSLNLDFLPDLSQLLNEFKNTNVEITTSVFPLIHYLRNAFPTILLGVIFGDKDFEQWMTKEFIKTKVTKMMQLMKANVAHVPLPIINDDFVAECHKHNLKVHSSIYKKSIEEQVQEYELMSYEGVDQCTFDDITLLDKLK